MALCSTCCRNASWQAYSIDPFILAVYYFLRCDQTRAGKLSPLEMATMATDLKNFWLSEGYIVVRGLFTPERTEQLASICEEILQQWYCKNPETGEPGGNADTVVMRHLNHPGYFDHAPEALNSLMDAVADNAVIETCRTILNEPPLFRCTSLFMNPTENSQDGNWHRDSQFLYPDESEEKKLFERARPNGGGIQLQVALLPSDDIEIVPRSHRRWDTAEEYKIRKTEEGANNRSNAMPWALRVALQPGDVLAFNAFGLHRGRYHTDKKRRTLMLTYTRTSNPSYDYFSHQPWFDEANYMEIFQPRTRAFFKPFVSAYRKDWQKMGGPYTA